MISFQLNRGKILADDAPTFDSCSLDSRQLLTQISCTDLASNVGTSILYNHPLISDFSNNQIEELILQGLNNIRF